MKSLKFISREKRIKIKTKGTKITGQPTCADNLITGKYLLLPNFVFYGIFIHLLVCLRICLPVIIFVICLGHCLSIVLLFNEFFVMASPVLRVVMVNLENRGACVFLYVFGELLDRIIVQLTECFSVENG